ncbi:MAG TPA: NAD-dependent epimerase/dehydratase family protein [Terriglobales bacterium]|nr:NAD-dependent epimerase/dehydratase family protein [Terriglobales bacterium]
MRRSIGPTACELMIQRDDAILITGGSGLVGTSLREHLQSQGFTGILTPTSAECDLTNRKAVLEYFLRNKPGYVFHMAGLVRGLLYNLSNHGEAYLKNTLINTHVIEACHEAGVKKVVAMGSVAMYPELDHGTPLTEEDVWKGPPHSSQYGYAQAKRGMLAQLQTFEASYGMPYALAFCASLYGPHDRFNSETGHVVPSLIKKFHDARQAKTNVTVWGDGSAHRDFLYIKDCCRALHVIMDHVSGPVNLASGATRKIRDVVNILAAHSGMTEHTVWDTSKPSGYIYRAYDVSRLRAAGFTCQYTLEQALPETYDWYASHAGAIRH